MRKSSERIAAIALAIAVVAAIGVTALAASGTFSLSVPVNYGYRQYSIGYLTSNSTVLVAVTSNSNNAELSAQLDSSGGDSAYTNYVSYAPQVIMTLSHGAGSVTYTLLNEDTMSKSTTASCMYVY